jgi:hypothetical protein
MPCILAECNWSPFAKGQGSDHQFWSQVVKGQPVTGKKGGVYSRGKWHNSVSQTANL